MKNLVILFVGIILIGTGVLVYFSIGASNTTIVVNGVRDNSSGTKAILQYSIGGFLAGLGLIFTLAGMRGRSRDAKHQKQIQHIIQTGIAVDGTATFVDRNYSILINKRPIYSIVEYTYKDRSGTQYSRRVETIPSDFVIRNKIEVGGKVSVKYLSEDPSQSTILML